MPCCPRAEDVRRKVRFQALATGLALTMGAVSALYREKKKAGHTLHDRTFDRYFCCSRDTQVIGEARLLL